MWKRADLGAMGSSRSSRRRRLLIELSIVIAVAIAYPLATPEGASRAGDTSGAGGLAPPIGGAEGRAVPELATYGMFFKKGEPARAVEVSPPPSPTTSPEGPAKSGAKSSRKSSTPSGQQAPRDPDDLGMVLITCYTMKSNTASGSMPNTSTAATSPGFLPLGTVISIEGVGVYTVADRGPLGRKIDIWMASDEECTAFGKQYHRVRVISRP